MASFSCSGDKNNEFPVFADTSLGTHIAISISPHFTAANFARELESEHLKCFPKVGEIRISKLMVKRRSCFYCLPESLPMKYAFQGVKKTRFVYIEACALTNVKKTCLSDCKCQQIEGHIINNAEATNRFNPVCCVISGNNDNVSVKSQVPKLLPAARLSKKKRRATSVKRKCFPCHLENGHENVNLLREEGFSGKERLNTFQNKIADEHREERSTFSQVETASDTLSVSNIIKKYFTNHDEVTSDSKINSATVGKTFSQQLKVTTYDNCSNDTIYTTPHWIASTPRRVTVSPYCTQPESLISVNKSKRTKPGKHVVLAFSKLGIFSSEQTTNTSICRLRRKKLALQKETSFVKNLVFEISDGSD